MKTFLTTVLSLCIIAINIALTVHLMDVVRVVSAIQAAWGKAEGATYSIPWLPLFVIIPAGAVAGSLYAAERLYQLARKPGISPMVQLATKVMGVQAACLWLGRITLLIARPVDRTIGNILLALSIPVFTVVVWVAADKLGKRQNRM